MKLVIHTLSEVPSQYTYSSFKYLEARRLIISQIERLSSTLNGKHDSLSAAWTIPHQKQNRTVAPNPFHRHSYSIESQDQSEPNNNRVINYAVLHARPCAICGVWL